jgi:hypothetical protein
MLHSRGSYFPYVWCGVVIDVLGPRDFKIDDASLLPHTLGNGSTWVGIARGNAVMRQSVRVRRADQPVEVYDCAFCVPWVGDLPTKDQN